MKPTFFKGVALGAAICFVLLAVTSALAGTGVGDVFNLGQTSSVDATSALQGTVNNGAQLQVTNGGAGAGVRGDSAAGRGLVGDHTNATGSNPGIEGSTSSTDNNAAAIVGRVLPDPAGISSAGVRGINNDTGSHGYGVWGSHAGSGAGVFGTSQSIGVHGTAPETGVCGTSGMSLSRCTGAAGTGVKGAGAGYGVSGYSHDGYGVLGMTESSGAAGLYGFNLSGGPALRLFTLASTSPMQVNSPVKVANLNADLLDGRDSGDFVRSDSVYVLTSNLVPGRDELEGTCNGGDACHLVQPCHQGDILIGGGIGNIDPGTTVLFNWRTTAGWYVRVQNNSTVDTFQAQAICADFGAPSP